MPLADRLRAGNRRCFWRTEPISFRTPLALLPISLGIIFGVWWWIATPVTLARAPIDPSDKLECVSYAPFRGEQTPLDPTTRIGAEQIEQDLTQLAKISKCVRTYSVDNGLEQLPAIAGKVGLKVLQGIWLGNERAKNLAQIAVAVGLTKDHPNVISSLVVGNEVLLRGEMTAADLAATIRLVKSQVKVPVTYADVWEYWLRNRDIYDAVDFVTIHILPYWEDLPIRARNAASHVDQIRKRVAVAFPSKEILIGETGWPSAGRMREGALPSRANQARVVSEILGLAKLENFRVNLIEAYDQPWKRELEGTVGGYWGLIDADNRELKYPAGLPISNFPQWKLSMAAGMVLSVLVFAAAMLTLRRKPWPPRLVAWLAVGASATAGGVLLGVAVDKMLVESYGWGRWLQWGLLLASGVLTPILAAIALVSGRALPTFLELFGPREDRSRSFLTYALGLSVVVTTLIGAQSALGFTFDPRYRDFPFASLTMAVLPLFLLMLLNRPQQGVRPIAEAVFAGVFAVSALYTVFNEGPKNWQSLWTCAVYAMMALTLWQARAAQTPK
ncbi:beta-(1-6) glucans synthase [Rhodopseudomonas pseudopalustris]|uniref:Endo-1,3-beta-glucanase btgC n=1 Tax=Rhodopseudomonas pseudopalustris TaxID=1513892 RepID=A0A1H8SUI6_9BRAD|nr:beta-(1-6) glucans synthase [Rhodopseudomonas pseudopalustris]SEO81994.1 Exo-beta-1,3-glucanase, GH17 family [Rhodopseudomonas pseudopalustris]